MIQETTTTSIVKKSFPVNLANIFALIIFTATSVGNSVWLYSKSVRDQAAIEEQLKAQRDFMQAQKEFMQVQIDLLGKRVDRIENLKTSSSDEPFNNLTAGAGRNIRCLINQ